MNALDGAALAFDPQRVAALGGERAKRNDVETLRQVAQEFESLLINQVMKSMRTASFGDELFDSDATKTFTSLLDEQYAQSLSRSPGLGLADLIVRQMTLAGHLQKSPDPAVKT